MIDWLKKIFGARSNQNNKPTISTNSKERPADWNLTIEDLIKEMNEGKRKVVGQPELDWAREYQRSLIPANYRFAKKGDLYESKNDQEVEFLTSWFAAYTGGGKGVLYKGEQVWIDSDPMEENSIGAYALAVDYKKLELRMVPSSDRNHVNYGGYYISIDTKILNENFDLIQENFEKEKFE